MTTRHYERGQGSHVPTSHVAVSTSLVLLLVLIGFSSAQTNVTEVQSYNGYGNNRMNPTWGAVGTPYIRMVPPTYGPNQSPGGSTRPNARLISNQLFSKSPFLYSNKNVTDFLPNWGLLLHMDVMVTERNQSDPFHIPVTSPDPFFNPAGLSNISISMNRSVHIAVDATRNLRVHVNSVSSFIDGSSLYGLTNETAMSMRSFRDGLLKSQNFSTGEFPVKTTGGMFLFPLMDANRTPQILAIHIVLLREHQRRAREIKAVYPNWSDEQIYQRARRWVIAIIQKITYEQYLPVVLGEPLARYTAYNDTINPQADIFFTNVAMRYGHSAIAQLVMRYEENGQVSDVGHQLIRNCIFGSNPWDVQTHGVESLLRGMAIQKEQLVDVSVVDDMRDHFVVRGVKLDLPAIDVQRGRDTGIPDYNTCRESFGLHRVFLWSEITSDIDVQIRLRQLYNDDINSVDAIVGAMAENHQGSGVLGELFGVSIREQFTRLRDGDRFWYESPGILTDDEKLALSRISLGDIIKLNSRIIAYPANPFRTSTGSSPLSQSAPSSPTTSSDSSLIEMLGTLRLTWTVRASDGMVDFLFQSNASGWFGFGIGSNMVNADIYFATKSSNGSLTVIDSWSSSSGAPQPDTSVGGQNSIQRIQDVTSLYPTSRQSVQFSRALTTSDSRDADIPNGPIRLIFAFHPSSHDYRYHESNRGVVDVNLYAKGVSLSASGSPMVPMSLKILHGFSMFLAFAVIYPVGIFVARYYTDLNKWVELHATLMATATSDVLITALTAIIGSYSDSDHLHVRLGIIIVGLVFTTMFTGYVASKITVKFLQPYITYIRLLHRILGFGTYAFGLVTGYFGAVAIQYGDETKWWIAKAYIGLVGFMPILLFIYGEFYKRTGMGGIKNSNLQKAMAGDDKNEKLPLFMWEDVNQRVSLGAKWIIIEDTIYDIESFIDRHPGGSAIIRNYIGLDATNIFKGNTRSTMERSRSKKKSQADKSAFRGSSHKHSRFAVYLLGSMAVGRLRKSEDDDHSEVLSRESSVVSKINVTQRPQSILMRTRSWKDNEDTLPQSPQRTARPAISANQFRTYTVSTKAQITGAGAKYPVYHLRYDFERVDDKFTVKPGQSVSFQHVDEDGKIVTRSYTPLRCDNEGGIDFFVKMYGGEMTKHLLVTRSIRIRGPVQSMEVLNRNGINGCWKVLGLIAGGTGLSPMLLMIDYHLKYGSRDPVSNRPTFKIHLLIINHSDSDIFAAKIVEDIEKACEGALTVNYMISTPSQQYLPKPGIIIGKLSQEVIVSTMPRLPVDNKSPTRTPSVIPTQRQGVGHPSVLTHRKSFTFSPNLSDKGIIEAGENGSIDAEIPALSTKNPSSPAYRSNTRDDAAIRFNIRESGGATGMPMLMREDSSYKRRSYEDNNRMTQARSRTFSIQQSVLGNDVGLPSPAAQEVDLDLDMCRNMAMMVCGPTMMNNAVSDLLQDMGYPADMIYTM